MPSKWSGKVTKESDSLDLEKGVFTWHDPHKIALSLKNSAEQSKRRKSSAKSSAISMMNFYINRVGKNLTIEQREILEATKRELQKIM